MPLEFKERFLKNTSLKEQAIEEMNLEWAVLKDIYNHHIKNWPELENIATTTVRNIERIPGVHSVGWRIKDAYHLIDKIIRKKMSGHQKYSDINQENYRYKITDLIGIRALHLFKKDLDDIHKEIESKYDLLEKAVMYSREGDPVIADKKQIKDTHGIIVKVHNEGYRSVHYILKINIDKTSRSIIELQVRTLYEEAWSEIDHKLRYPTESESETIKDGLMILNRISGGSDELSSFLLGLKAEAKYNKDEISRLTEKQTALVAEINDLASGNKNLTSKLTALQENQRTLQSLNNSRLSRFRKDESTARSIYEFMTENSPLRPPKITANSSKK